VTAAATLPSGLVTFVLTGRARCLRSVGSPRRGRSRHAPGRAGGHGGGRRSSPGELEEDIADLDRTDVLATLGELEGERGQPDAVAMLAQAVELLRRFPPDGMLAASLASLAE
jgi:hypothetical protein